MTTLVNLITAAALVSGVAVLLTTRSWRAALRVLLDLLTAAGLIRLSTAQHWTDLATAAAIIALRQLVSTVILGDVRPGAGDRHPRARPRPTRPHRGPAR